MRWYRFRNHCAPVLTPLKDKIWYASEYHKELIHLQFIISIIKRHPKPLSVRVQTGSNNERSIFCRRPHEPGQTVKTRQSSPINFPEPREMGTPLTRDPKYNLTQPRTATATTGFPHVEGET